MFIIECLVASHSNCQSQQFEMIICSGNDFFFSFDLKDMYLNINVGSNVLKSISMNTGLQAYCTYIVNQHSMIDDY